MAKKVEGVVLDELPKEVEAQVEKGEVVKVSYRVFDKRANLVAQVNSEDEARTEAAKFGGFYNLVK
jgi:hypothetical protein